MRNAFQTRALAIALAIATLAVCILAALNFQQENSFDEPTDGISWTEANRGVVAQPGLRADHVPADSPGDRAGIRKGDILLAVNDQPTASVASFEREINNSGIWSHATYSILRPVSRPGGANAFAKLDIQIIVEPTDRSINQGLRIIALVYLCIGFYVLFRRWTAPKSLHFFVFCLASFVLYTFKFTTQFDLLDMIVFWGKIVALALQPALFLHFAVDFSGSDEDHERFRVRRRALGACLYLPGAFLVILQAYAFHFWTATGQLLHRLDQFVFGYLGLYYAIAASVFVFRYAHARSPLERQQLKWLTRGTLLAFAPYTLLNVVPLLFDMQVPSLLTKLSAGCLEDPRNPPGVCVPFLDSNRTVAPPARPIRFWLFGPLLCDRRVGLRLPLCSRALTVRAAAAQVAYPRNAAGLRALYLAQCRSSSVRHAGAQPADQTQRRMPGYSAIDV